MRFCEGAHRVEVGRHRQLGQVVRRRGVVRQVEQPPEAMQQQGSQALGNQCLVVSFGGAEVGEAPRRHDGHVGELRGERQEVRQRGRLNIHRRDDEEKGQASLGFFVEAELDEIERMVAGAVGPQLRPIEGDGLDAEPVLT